MVKCQDCAFVECIVPKRESLRCKRSRKTLTNRGLSISRKCDSFFPVKISNEVEVPEHLSKREKKAWRLALKGLSNEEIAGKMGINKKTAGNYVHSVKKYLRLEKEREKTLSD